MRGKDLLIVFEIVAIVYTFGSCVRCISNTPEQKSSPRSAPRNPMPRPKEEEKKKKETYIDISHYMPL